MEDRRRILIVCGGTGGHLAPGIAVAERLERRGHGCLLVVSRKEIDGRLREKYDHLDFVPVPGAGFSLSPVKLLRFFVATCAAFLRAGAIIGRFRPDAVLVFGGFLSPPYVVWGRLRGCRIAVHEANRRPGRAVRSMARLAHRMYLPPGVRLGGVRRSKVRPSGYPLRREIQHIGKEAARARLGFTGHQKTLVVIGGSQGALALNEWVNANYPVLAREGINVISVTGPRKGIQSRVDIETAQGGVASAVFLPFTDEMNLLLSVADLVISRAGAGAIAELTACLAPSIMIPYPHASDQHQDANARFFEQQGGCIMLSQAEIDTRLLREVRDLIFNDAMLHRVRENLRALDFGDQADSLVSDLLSLINLSAGPRPTQTVRKEASA